MRVEYPIALDNDFGVWQAFANHYWPALYLVDAEGRIRHHHFGEGDNERSEMVIQRLLAERNGGDPASGLVSVDPEGAEVAADWDHLRSSETYLGHGVVQPQRRWHVVDARLVRRDAARGREVRRLPGPSRAAGPFRPRQRFLNARSGRIAFRFHARDVHLVMAPGAADVPVAFRVFIDGHPAGTDSGTDVDGQGSGKLDQSRMYQLIRQRGAVDDCLFEIEFLDEGAKAHASTFG